MSDSDYAIVTKNVRSNFTMVDNNVVHDKRLSWKSLGLITYILSLPPNYKLMMKGLGSAKKDGMESTRSGIKKLEELGYLVITRKRDQKGRYVKYQNWVVTDTPIVKNPNENNINRPQSGFPDVDNPTTDNPALENPTLYNTKAIQDFINTTTTISFSEFKIIDMLSKAEKLSIEKALLKIYESDADILLCELEGALKMRKVKNAVPFLMSLIDKQKNGSFQPSAALKVLAERENKEKIELQIKAAQAEKIITPVEKIKLLKEIVSNFAKNAKPRQHGRAAP